MAASERSRAKAMCTHDQPFKARQLKLKDVELYLSQIQKKDAGKKRKAENQRKFELGGAVLTAFKKLNIDISNETPQQITNRIVNTSNFHNKVRKSLIFKDVKDYKKEYFEANKLVIQVLEGLHTWKKNGEPLTVIEIKNAVEKGQKQSISVKGFVKSFAVALKMSVDTYLKGAKCQLIPT